MNVSRNWISIIALSPGAMLKRACSFYMLICISFSLSLIFVKLLSLIIAVGFIAKFLIFLAKSNSCKLVIPKFSRISVPGCLCSLFMLAKPQPLENFCRFKIVKNCCTIGCWVVVLIKVICELLWWNFY